MNMKMGFTPVLLTVTTLAGEQGAHSNPNDVSDHFRAYQSIYFLGRYIGVTSIISTRVLRT